MTSSIPEQSLLDVDPILFEREFDRHCFTFNHRLSDHPLLKLDRLLKLAQKLAQDPKDIYLDAGDIGVGQRWDQAPGHDLPVDEVMQQLETAQAWILLRSAQKDPEYVKLLDACMDEIVALSGKDLDKVMNERNALIFMNSPHRKTAYHIDRECSWLFQIQGRKTICVFDRADREVPKVSVSLNVNFHYRDAIAADIYRANYWLRRLGLTPTPPHHSAFRDSIKRTLFPIARKARKALQGNAREA